MTDLLALADRVENLTGPDRDVDEAIRVAMSYPPKPWNYTASLDAAMTLVPEGWRCGFEQAGINDRDESPMAWCWPFDSSWEPDWQRGDDSYKGHDKGVRAIGSTLAIALTAACLRARASIDKGEA